MEMVTLLFLAFLSCARTAKAHQADEDSTENFMEVPPSVLESQLDESISSQPLSQEKSVLNSFLRTLLHGRTSRSSFHFQPQRFGRDERSSILGDSRIHSRGWDSAPPFWSMAVPQRFGRKK
ncbi:PREDICTED: pro-FMRFamide-related neuropeptide FF [Nanorana parkeri]|uniref:pro-FMRFamide-related neuropeptide FF n=1 Tax=Nanorana parkeri TaxID=125878 RepID=UPI0008543275|nr:PREDICTED: pro-FMRFamide-related neuropeptide FF [Nanorana parkeri]